MKITDEMVEAAANVLYAHPQLKPCKDSARRAIEAALSAAPRFEAMSGVSVYLTATHVDPYRSEGTHQHTWVITVFYMSTPFRDGRDVKDEVSPIIESLHSGGEMKSDFWSQEAIAKEVLRLSPGYIASVRVNRAEGFEATVWR